MFVNFRGSIIGTLGWQRRSVALFLAAATVVTAVHEFWGIAYFHLSTMPLAVVGAAIGIFVSFRTNSAYDRWWEGRKLWGRLVNSSRHFATQVAGYLPRDGGAVSDAQRTLVHRQIAYVHALRVILRGQLLDEDEDFSNFALRAKMDDVSGQSNPTHAILQGHADQLVALANDGALDERRLESMDRTIAALLDIQGGCERIKKTPFPMGYSFIAERLIQVYGILFPLGLVADLGWLTIPISTLVCLSFALISETGRVLEDPFTMFWPALPLTALSKTIEVNLRERLGEPPEDLPPLPTPDARGVLM